jgi:exodeoxyribonuclease X
MKTLIFLDTETTGNTKTDFLCQLAFKSPTETYCELFKPQKSIPPEASAVTHITDKHVVDKPTFKSSPDYPRIKTLLEDASTVAVIHNAKFDLQILKNDDIVVPSYICTLKLARFLDTENKIPQYKLQFLRYYLGIELDAPAHDALGDVLVLEALFERLYAKFLERHDGDRERALEEMMQISMQPMEMKTFTFGKHITKTIAEVARTDRAYLQWLYDQKKTSEQDEEDWLFTLEKYLGK